MISPVRRLELYFLATLPAVITLLLLLLCVTPKHLSGLGNVMPVLPLIPVFYWGMLHAREMPYWFVFALGLITDAAIDTPLGLSPLLYLSFLMLLHAQRKYIHKEGFIIKWGYFGALLMVTLGLSWIAMSLLSGHAQALSPAFIQWLLTMGCYPVLHKGFDAIYRHTSDRRWQILHSH